MARNRFFAVITILAGLIAMVSGMGFVGLNRTMVVGGGICWVVMGIYFFFKGDSGEPLGM
jgi:hypothetical protein